MEIKVYKAGGGVLNGKGDLTISSSTIVGNTGDLGAGIAGSHPLKIKNSIVARNVHGATGGGLSGQIVSQGYNVFQDTNRSYLSGDLTGNIVGVDPDISSLGMNGGVTATHSLNYSSIARNHGNPAGCFYSNGELMSTDQRGFPRHQFGRCDIGAFEADGVSVKKTTGIQPFLFLLLSGD